MTSISGKPDPVVLHITVADVVEALGRTTAAKDRRDTRR